MVLGLAIEAHSHSDFDSGASETTARLSPGRNVGAAWPEQRARKLALYRPVITRTLTACTTMVVASFPAASCTSYSSPGPNCRFTFRDQDVRKLYDCSLIIGIPAGKYIDEPLEDRLVRPTLAITSQLASLDITYDTALAHMVEHHLKTCAMMMVMMILQAIGTLTYRWDKGLTGVASPQSITMNISALNSSCGSIAFAGSITPSAQWGSLVGMDISIYLYKGRAPKTVGHLSRSIQIWR